MGKANKQAEAVNHIQELLIKRGLNISSRKLHLEDNQHWVLFELNQRQIGIDSASGVWVRKSVDHDWRCIAMPCSVSGAIQAVGFLLKTELLTSYDKLPDRHSRG
jgi:hypothetical protein